MNNYDRVYKILIVGDSGVGKSCILERFATNNFFSCHQATIGIDFKTKIVQKNGINVIFKIWDTAGQERFRSITSAYYRGASGIMVCYDITNYESFDSIKTWINDIQQYADENIPIIIVGNKLEDKHRHISKLYGEQCAKEYGADFIEVSAKDGTNINTAFNIIADKIHMSLSPLPNEKNSIMTFERLDKPKQKCCNI